MERTYIMIKPDGVQRGLVGEIICRFEKKVFNFTLIVVTFKLSLYYWNHKFLYHSSPSIALKRKRKNGLQFFFGIFLYIQQIFIIIMLFLFINASYYSLYMVMNCHSYILRDLNYKRLNFTPHLVSFQRHIMLIYHIKGFLMA